MDLQVRPARPDDPAAGLLYESARSYYDAYAGGEAHARRLVSAVYPRSGHSGSYAVCRVALLDGELAGVLAGFRAAEAEALAQRFLALTLPRVRPWHWPRVARHLRVSRRVGPLPPAGSWYVDALAVAPAARRRGVARALLDDAAETARALGATGVALDTGLENAPARALYASLGFQPREERPVASAAAARALGGAGFVGFFRAPA